MNVYTNNNFTGYWPVGTAAVVVAKNADDAAYALSGELTKQGLAQSIDPFDMKLVNTTFESVALLCDGNY